MGKGNKDKHGTLQDLLYMIYPRGPSSPWGWSRTGWGWQQWWALTENLLSVLDDTAAFDHLAALLDRVERDGDGTALSKQSSVWTEKRLASARALLCKFGHVEAEDDLIACLDASID